MTRYPFGSSAMMLTVGGALLLAACHSKPTGQVAAVVNGDEVTTTELNAELQGAQLPPGADGKAVQRQALQRVIDRKVLADAARADKLDQSPEYVVRRQQVEDALLVQLLTQKVARGLKTPDPADVDKFIAANPQMFAARQILAVDQLQFQTPTQQDYLKQLAAAHSMSAVVAVLDRLGIKYQRRDGQIDTAQLPPQVVDQIRRLPAGEPFVVPNGPYVVVSLVTGSKPAPQQGDNMRTNAANAVRNVKLGEAMQQRLKSEQAAAKIEYQPGFAPNAAPAPVNNAAP